MEPLQNKWGGLQTRIMSALVMISIVGLAIIIGGVVFYALVLLIAVLLFREWEALVEAQPDIFRLIGYPYILIPCASIIWLRTVDATLLFALIAMVTATDTGAYFTGKKWGRRPLAPSISPNKTIEGLAGGVLASMVAGLLFSPYIHVPHATSVITLLGALFAVVAQAGDLFKSWIKRRAGVKDSGNLIPGHGGVLDRLDGYLTTAPLWAAILYVLKY